MTAHEIIEQLEQNNPTLVGKFVSTKKGDCVAFKSDSESYAMMYSKRIDTGDEWYYVPDAQGHSISVPKELF